VSARRLIVSGDDFGAAPEVNAAVIRAHREGILTSTSLMVRGDAAAEAVALARATPSLAVGRHLVLVQGRPAAPAAEIPALVARNGAFRDAPVASGIRFAWTAIAHAGRVQLRREIMAQLDSFAASGLPLAHVDGHLNMHLHPMVLPILLDVAPRYGIHAVRLLHENVRAALAHDRRHAGRKIAEGLAFNTLAAWAAPRLRAAGIRVADRVYGLHQTGHIDEHYILALIARLPAGLTELYCHPSLGVSSMLAPYQRGYDHAGELAALTSERVRDALRAAAIELVSYATAS
jgi:hopanoid biosynthesis associated protein HpnK